MNESAIAMELYTLRGIQSMLGLSRSVLSGLIAAGFVTPARGPRREYRFTFQDVVLLRTAYSLQQASIAPRKILRSLRRLKATLPDELPLSGLRITAVGNEIAVSEGDTRWHVDSGQLLLDFEVKPARGAVTLKAKDDAPEPIDWFDRALELESDDRPAAEAAYRRAVAQAPDHVDAVLNLGVLLCEDGRCADAVALYRQALKRRPDEALLHFNLGVALEDLGRADDALASYDACLQLKPKLADAHYNAARLHEQRGDSRQAIRHYSEYRRLQR
jgi:tetratricopeptide (TPR) repeat protein